MSNMQRELQRDVRPRLITLDRINRAVAIIHECFEKAEQEGRLPKWMEISNRFRLESEL